MPGSVGQLVLGLAAALLQKVERPLEAELNPARRAGPYRRSTT